MKPNPESRANAQTRIYSRTNAIVFLKTNEFFGGFSNMAAGFPLCVNGFHILTSEALYQACRFPHLPEVQALIIEQRSPMTAKMKSKPYRRDSRPDWDHVRVKIMRWCLRVKLAQNWAAFSKLLLATGDRPIVEESRRDDFWGAKAVDKSTLVGTNVLGRLLMELRETVKAEERDALRRVEPLPIRDFLLDGRPIETVTEPDREVDAPLAKPAVHVLREHTRNGGQTFLFGSPEYANQGSPSVSSVDLKPYPVMKNSGVPWLGKVPVHWEVQRGKTLFRCIDIRSATGDEELLTVSSDRGVVPRSSAKVTMFKAESYIGYKLCWPGDLVINSLWAWARGLGVADRHGIVSSAYGVYRLHQRYEEYSAFINALVRSTPFNWELQVRSKGIWISRFQLTDEAFLCAPFPIPAANEQAAMVRFLNHADRRIRRYIRAKQKLIKLLEEQKQVIIRRAVTRGLDPNARLKPSGVEWLGDVPEHWEVCKVSHFARVGNGSTPSRGNSSYWSGGTYPWLNSSTVNRSPIASAYQFVTEIALRECHLPKIAPGSVLVAITGQGKTRGTSAVLSIEATINQHIAYITPRRSVVSPEYLHLAFVAAYRELRRISDDAGSTKGALTCGDVAHFNIALPPSDEQQRIISAILRDTRTTEAGISHAEREISLLSEYRTRLIADVVTGKLDVREAAARLPEEAEETEQLEQSDAVTDDFDEAPEEAEA
jgi:type I restriction enzyme S subunit